MTISSRIEFPFALLKNLIIGMPKTVFIIRRIITDMFGHFRSIFFVVLSFHYIKASRGIIEVIISMMSFLTEK